MQFNMYVLNIQKSKQSGKRLQNRGTNSRTPYKKMTISCFQTCITQIEDDYDLEMSGKPSVKIAIIVRKM